MAFKQANKSYNNGDGHRHWTKISQAHVDAKKEILARAAEVSSEGWSYLSAKTDLGTLADWVFHDDRVKSVYQVLTNKNKEQVILVTQTRNSKQRLVGETITPEILIKLLTNVEIGKRVELRINFSNCDVYTKSRQVIPDTTSNIVNMEKLIDGSMRVSSEFDQTRFKKLGFKDMENLALKLVKDPRSELSYIIPSNANTFDFINEVFRVWNRI